MRFFLFFLGLLLIGLAQAQTPPEEIRKKLQQVIDAEEYQTDLKAAPPAPDYKPPPILDSLPKHSSSASEFSSSMLWLLLGVIIFLLVFWLVREFIQTRKANTTIAPTAVEIAPLSLEAPRQNPEALAQQGLFAEAIHALLLSALVLLLQKQQQEVSATSREILQQSKLLDDSRSSLATLVNMVEKARFGKFPVDESDYLRCKEAHRRIEVALS